MRMRLTNFRYSCIWLDLSYAVLHSDRQAVLQVTTDCRPEQLLEYLQGEAATAASIAADAHADSRKEEQALLDAAGEALGAKFVMRMCSRHQQPKINQALQQLIQNAEAVKQSFDLSGGRSSVSLKCCLEQHQKACMTYMGQMDTVCVVHTAYKCIQRTSGVNAFTSDHKVLQDPHLQVCTQVHRSDPANILR